MIDGLERLAVAYGWPPEVGREMDVVEFGAWVELAEAWIRARYTHP